MSTRINPEFKEQLTEFGKGDWNECYHCGNCTAICPLSKDGFLFPRKDLRYIQLGMQEKLDASLEPWLCYYCGECSETCPRDANPGELMMTLRRYLTSRYDWTGLSKKFYTNHLWEYAVIGLIFIVIIALFLVFLPLRPDAALMVNESGGVMINSLVEGVSAGGFLRIIEFGDWTMAGIIAFLLISNLMVMFYRTILSDKNTHIPVSAYFTEAWQLVWNFVTQSKFSKCDDKTYWVGHLLLMTGYTIMFILVVVFLPVFQVETIEPWWHWQRLLGYYATFGILYFLAIVAYKRLKKIDVKLKYSHPSDWIFIVLLALTTISGILVHIFRLEGMVAATYYTYIFHLAVLVPMLMVEVPFSKWSHLAYRPFAIYFARLKTVAAEVHEEKKEWVPAGV